MKEIPKIFKPNINHEINNNRNVFYSFKEEKETKKELKEDPIDTLNRLIRGSSYIFNKNVMIKTKDKTYNTKIAGKMGDKIITLDGDSINMYDVIKIEEK